MNLFSKLSQTKVAKISAFAMILALVFSFVGPAMAATSGTGAHTVVVRVFDGDPINNVRVPGANVLMVGDDRQSPSHGLRADTDANGVVTFSNVDEGGFNIEIRKNGYNGQDYHVLVNESMQVDATLINLVTPPANPTPTQGECTPTPPRGQPLLNIWPIADNGANCTDYPLLVAKNVTQNGGYSHNVSASTGDTLQVRLYVHNGVLDFPENAAQNLMVKASLPSASGNITAEAWADNATKVNSSQKGGNVAVGLGGDQHLSFVPGSVKVYSRGPVLIGGGSDAVVGSGLNLGEMRGCFQYLRFVTFEVQVNANQVTPPPAPQPTPPPAQGSISLTKSVRNVTQGNTTFVSQVGANPGDQVEFQIVATAHNTVNNIVVSDVLPAKLSYVNNSLRVDGADGGNNLSAINLGNRTNSAPKITFRATVGSANQFVVGRNEMTNTASVASSAGTSSASAAVVVTINAPADPTLALSKKAYNYTQKKDATTTAAKLGDVIQYILTVENKGNAVASGFVIQDNISDVLQLADLTDYSGATLDSSNTLVWPAQNIAPGAKVEKIFLVRVKSTIADGSDLTMTNVYGNTVNVTIKKFTAPPTGSTVTLSLILGFVLAAVIVGVRKYRQMVSAKVS